MEITIQTFENCALVTLSGEIDHVTGPQVEQELLALIGSGKSNLAINLQNVTYISSGGLRALISATTEARRSEPPGDVLFAQLSPVCKDTFTLVGFYDLYRVYETDAAAVASF